jgi:hypothetical protein
LRRRAEGREIRLILGKGAKELFSVSQIVSFIAINFIAMKNKIK